MPNLLTMFDAKQWIKGAWHANTMRHESGDLAPRCQIESPSYADVGPNACNGMCAMGFIHTDLGGAQFKLVTDDFKFDPYTYGYQVHSKLHPKRRVAYFRNILRSVGEMIAGEVFDAWSETHSETRVVAYSNMAQHGEEEHERNKQAGYTFGSEQIVNFNDSDDTPEEDVRDFFEALMDNPRYNTLRRLVLMPDDQLTMYAEGYLDSLEGNAGQWYTQAHYKQLKRANVI